MQCELRTEIRGKIFILFFHLRCNTLLRVLHVERIFLFDTNSLLVTITTGTLHKQPHNLPAPLRIEDEGITARTIGSRFLVTIKSPILQSAKLTLRLFSHINRTRTSLIA